MKRLNPFKPGTDQYRAWNKGYAACQRDWIDSLERRPSPKPARWRESKLGRFVTRAFALANPATTQGERR